jgi:InsA N-terminal domain
MKCPKCTSTECKKNGTNSAGTQRYCCKTCNCTFVPNAQHGGHNRIDDGKTPQQRQNDKRKLQRKNNT